MKQEEKCLLAKKIKRRKEAHQRCSSECGEAFTYLLFSPLYSFTSIHHSLVLSAPCLTRGRKEQPRRCSGRGARDLCLVGVQVLVPPLRYGLQPWRVGPAPTPELGRVGRTPVLGLPTCSPEPGAEPHGAQLPCL